MVPEIHVRNSIFESDFADQYCNPPRNPLPAKMVSINSIKKVWWKCNKGHFFQKTPFARSQESLNNNGCPTCLKERADKNKEKAAKKTGKKTGKSAKGMVLISLEEKNPDLAKEYSSKNLIPVDKIAVSSFEKVLWECPDCGFEWKTLVCSRVYGRSGCPKCMHEISSAAHIAGLPENFQSRRR